ncbi:MAG: hypothetical protein JST21_15690 [Bacteroidetes bacterium]|nr:hypothetical protein [Bacteroidota bacterium]
MKKFISSPVETQANIGYQPISQMMHNIFFIVAIFISCILFLSSCDKDSSTPANSTVYATLQANMRQLWGEHMQWTYNTIDAFYHNSNELQPTLDRLLANQQDIGDAIMPYYGQVAGDTLTSLLTDHINLAVPVLSAAQSGDQAALDLALANWNANADAIADFLSSANPDNWNKADMESMMEEHITTTTTYAVDLLNNNFDQAIVDFGKAYDHMMMMADMLTDGIAKQFPDKF